MIHMADENPTIEDLLKKIEVLEGEMDELQGLVQRLLKIEKACYDMAQKLANKHGDALIDWWCVV